MSESTRTQRTAPAMDRASVGRGDARKRGGAGTLASTREAFDDAARLVSAVVALGDAWPGDARARRAVVDAGVAHGEARRTQDRPEEELFEDISRLRAALWSRIREAQLPPGHASDTILGIDAALDLAVAAALRGYYREVIARSGEWPLAVERLVDDVPRSTAAAIR